MTLRSRAHHLLSAIKRGKPTIVFVSELKNLIFLDPCAGRIPLVISDLTVAICLRRMPGLTVVHKIIVDEPVKPILLPIGSQQNTIMLP